MSFVLSLGCGLVWKMVWFCLVGQGVNYEFLPRFALHCWRVGCFLWRFSVIFQGYPISSKALHIVLSHKKHIFGLLVGIDVDWSRRLWCLP